LDTTTQGRRRLLENPFIPIPWGYRALLIVYILLYNVFTPGLRELLHGSTAPLVEWRFVVDVAEQLLTFLPILLYRSAYGWLHPLIFPTLFALAKGILRAPEQLLAPFFILGEPPVREMAHEALWGWSQEALACAALKAKLISMTALAAYYLGFFFGPQLRIPHLAFPKPRSVIPKALMVIVFSAVVFVVYMQSKGGLVSHMLSWRTGRLEALGGDGPIFVLIRSGTVASMLWFALDKTAYRHPLFWIAALFTVPVNFFTMGSRSAVVYTLIVYLMLWMLRYRKIPQGRVIVLGIVTLVLLGSLGTLRRSTYTGEVNWTVFTDFDLAASLEAAKEEGDQRFTNDGYLPTIAKVPDEEGFLYGSSYVSSLLFFVPRALWPDKPRGAGTMAGEIIFGGTAGVPPGVVGEAYWNFYIPGVVAIFCLYGLFHQWLALTFTQYAHVPAFWVLYVITVLVFSPTSVVVQDYLHQIIPAVVILCWMGALSFKKRKVSRYVFT